MATGKAARLKGAAGGGGDDDRGGLFVSQLTCQADLLRVTQLWDAGGAGLRTALLAGFLRRFGERPAADLELGLVGGASLLLARLVAALRLNGSHFSGGGVPAFCVPLSPLLAAVRVFLRAQQRQRFAAEAVEAGALAALLAVLRRPRLRAPHADAALRTLALLLAAGRRFKEAFAAADGLRVLCELLGQRGAATPAVAARVERLLLRLHAGNPPHDDQLAAFMCQLTESTETAAQLVACRLLAAVLPRASARQRAAVPALLALLRHPDALLHVEVAGALRVLMATDSRGAVVRGLVALLFPTGAVSADHPLYVTEPALGELYAEPVSHVFGQQAAAVRAAGLLAAGCARTLDALLAGGLVGGLLVALATTPHPPSQAAAARLLRRLAAERADVRARLETTLDGAQMALLTRDDQRLAGELSVGEAARIRAEAGFSYDWGGGGAAGETATAGPTEDEGTAATAAASKELTEGGEMAASASEAGEAAPATSENKDLTEGEEMAATAPVTGKETPTTGDNGELAENGETTAADSKTGDATPENSDNKDLGGDDHVAAAAEERESMDGLTEKDQSSSKSSLTGKRSAETKVSRTSAGGSSQTTDSDKPTSAGQQTPQES